MKEEEPIAFYKGIVPGLALVSYYPSFIFTKASVIDKRCYEWNGLPLFHFWLGDLVSSAGFTWCYSVYSI